MTSEKKLKLQVWVLILVVFVLGSATGASIDALYRQREIRAMNAARSAPGYSPMLERMKQDLDLSDRQVEQLRVVLTGTRKEITQSPGIKEIRDRMNTQIRALLTPEQQERFTELKTRREAEKAAKE